MSSNNYLVASVLLAAGAIAVAAPAHAGAQTWQAPSCGEWVVHREKSDTLALGNASWLLGYLSGMVAGSGKDYPPATDNASIYKWMDSYCRKNPLRDVASGGNALVVELTGKSGIQK